MQIVGPGVPSVTEQYNQVVEQHNLTELVLFHGHWFGKDLDNLFDECQLGIGSLARHRSGITHLRSLKNREYAARGIPFIYSEIDDDFEDMPYIMKVPTDESNINVSKVIDFYKSITISPLAIRSSIIDKLSWKSQMQAVINNMT